ncbi:hypothetical protein LXL04_034014 [Taraxacum kok-saghyz]
MTFSVLYCLFYIQVIYDLLEISSGHLELREDPEQGPIIAGLRCIKVNSAGRILETSSLLKYRSQVIGGKLAFFDLAGRYQRIISRFSLQQIRRELGLSSIEVIDHMIIINSFAQGHVLDFFASALDQVGVAEMKVVIERTCGLVVLAESFGRSVFKDSFRHVFEKGEESLCSCF